MSNFSSLILYIMIFSISAMFYYIGKKYENRFFSILSVIVPTLLSAFRYMVGSDYWQYLLSYKGYENVSLDRYILSYDYREIGFYIINRLSYLLFDSYVVMFGISSFLTIFFFYKAIENFDIKNKAMLYFLYLIMSFPTSLNVIRQYIAISICLYAVKYLMSDKLLKYIFWIILAYFFHASAIVMLPIYFIRKFLLEKKFRNLFITFVIGGVLVQLMFYITEAVESLNKYSSYETYDGDINNYSFYLNLFIFLVILFFRKKLIKKDINQLFLSFLTISLIAGLLGFTSPFIARIGSYFSITQIILLSNLIEVFDIKENKRIVSICLVIYAILLFTVTYYILGQSGVIPYRTIFSI